MPQETQPSSISKGRLWAGWIITSLVMLFMLFDSITKLMKVAAVMQAVARLGFAPGAAVKIGSILLICVVIYAIPPTAVLGAILLTGYLGGAVVTNMRAGDPIFETIFPILFGVFVWLGIYLREARLSALVPLRK